jgi:multicomponent Na+:H+ antiporter subunit E
MTPGTLSMDVSTDRKTLYIHAMFVDDAEELKKGLKENFEARVLKLLRD